MKTTMASSIIGHLHFDGADISFHKIFRLSFALAQIDDDALLAEEAVLHVWG